MMNLPDAKYGSFGPQRGVEADSVADQWIKHTIKQEAPIRHELARHLLENEKRSTTGTYEISINRPDSEVRVGVAALRVN